MKDREEYFTGAQRSQIVWQILLRTPYDVTRPDKVRQLTWLRQELSKCKFLSMPNINSVLLNVFVVLSSNPLSTCRSGW